MAEGIGLAASIISVVQITGSVITICYDYQAAAKDASWEISQIRTELEGLRSVLQQLEPRAKQAELAPPTPDAGCPALGLLCKPLADCLEILKGLEAKLKTPSWCDGFGPKRKALVQVLRWPLKQADTKKALESIARYKSTLALALSVDDNTLILAIQKLSLESQQDAQSIKRATADILKDVESTKNATAEVQRHVQVVQMDRRRRSIYKWLHAPDPSTNYNRARRSRQAKTGEWFTESETFSTWKSEKRLLWLYGKPGCGKTVLSSTIIHNIGLDCQLGGKRAMAFFYFDFNDTEKQKTESMIRSLIIQLSEQSIDVSEELESLYASRGYGTKQPQIDELTRVLQNVIKDMDKVYLILDALDESSDADELMSRIQEIQGWGYQQLRIILTSRRHHDIEKGIEPLTQPEERICIQSALVDADISTYIQERLLSDPKLKRWQGKPRIQEEIRLTLMGKADGMFRWAVCQLDALQDCLSITALRKALRSLPKTLDETYVRVLRNIPDEFSDYAVRILEWLTYSMRPIHLHELAEVVAVNLDGDPWFDYDARFADSREILSICSSLIAIEEKVEMVQSSDIEGSYSPPLPDEHATSNRTTIICRTQTTSELAITRKAESVFVEVRLAHFSVKEYLVSDRIRAQPAAKYALQDVQSNRSIAAICLAYLLQFDREDASTNDFMQEHPLCEYAAEYWVDHTVTVGQDLGDIRRLCLTFLQVDPMAYRDWKFLNLWPESEGMPAWTLDHCWVKTELNPLIPLASKGANELVALLLESGADINTEGGRGLALIAASANGHEETVRLLLDHNANINAAPGRTALRNAAEHGHEAIVRLLLANGADANAQWLDRHFPPFSMGYTPLQAAIWGGKGDTAIVKILLDHGANANLVFEQGLCATALEAACIFGGREAVIQLLIDAGADVNATVGALNHSVLQRSLMIWFPPSDSILCLLAHGARTDILSADELRKLEAIKINPSNTA